MNRESIRSYIGIGSNLGNKLMNCNHAIEEINSINGCSVKNHSPWFRTSPVGMDTDEWFINGVAEVDTTLSPEELMNSLLEIEKGMGRVRGKKWEPRIIDLDILIYGDSIINEPDLIIPHPLMHKRRFVLMPLETIAPHIIHPVIGLSIREILNKLEKNKEEVTLLKENR